MKDHKLLRILSLFALSLFLWSGFPLQAEAAEKKLVLKTTEKPRFVLRAAKVHTDPADIGEAGKDDAYTEEEIEMIAAVVMHEVGHCSKASKLAVTRVIANRLADGRFGKSIYDVLHARGQFTAIHNYYDHELPADTACMEAVREALSAPDHTGGALYFCNPSVLDGKTARWFHSLRYLFSVDGQSYYR